MMSDQPGKDHGVRYVHYSQVPLKAEAELLLMATVSQGSEHVEVNPYTAICVKLDAMRRCRRVGWCRKLN